MSGAVWIGVDLGTQSVRAAAVDDDGPRPGVASRPLRSTRWRAEDGSARHEQDPAAWCAAVDEVVGELVAGLPDPAAVGGVAVDGTSGTVVAVDGAGRPCAPGIMYDDARGQGHVERVREVGAEVWARLGYRVGGSWALPTLLALGPAPGHRHQTDVVTAHLVGAPTASDASTSLKTGYDALEGRWPVEVLAELGLDPATLPAVVPPGTVLGGIGAGAAERTGLAAGVPVVAGMTDGCAAQVAAGAVAPGQWNVVLGTTLVLKGVADHLVRDPGGTVYCHRGPQGGWWWPGGASNTGAAVLADLVDPSRFEALTASLDRDPVRPPVVLPLPGRGERFPIEAPSAEGFWFHDDGAVRPLGDLLAAVGEEAAFAGVAEGIAFLERLAFERVAALGADVSGARSITGGAAANRWWNQRRADVLGVPLRRPEHAEPAVGMAVLARAATTADGDEPDLVAAAGAVRDAAGGRTYEPRPDAALDDRYGRFRAALVDRGWVDR
ncbi:FGGY-family carbohydrate kinase [Actinomycetospora termitidis]|uniref:FGGY family carbohydrate kinase n=1 Tax=Actinomycetospora termitidis TaxID=3053470 RepID=A0ABT7MG22_9PSEU|nr:FGGY family carbohydrate kinase [Actinomycetospora sp. Odt1-22]MDL5158308.1 FGGY family carbohydrate kinase [Actinomycetospora sp. Odt1-22]